MKIKVLIVPFLIVLIIVMSIWVIMPKWKELQAKKVELVMANAKLEDVQEKNNKAAILARTLNGSTQQREVLMKFIPLKEQEEEMISNLNSLSGASGLAVYNIVVSAAVSAQPQVVQLTPAPESLPDGSLVPVEAGPVVTNFSITLGVSGGYEKIKELLAKIGTLQRFNSISVLKIAKATGQVGNESTSNNLQADITLNFNYLEQGRSAVNSYSEIFSSGQFDMSVVDMIKNKMNTAVNSLTVGSSGAPNPFMK